MAGISGFDSKQRFTSGANLTFRLHMPQSHRNSLRNLSGLPYTGASPPPPPGPPGPGGPPGVMLMPGLGPGVSSCDSGDDRITCSF